MASSSSGSEGKPLDGPAMATAFCKEFLTPHFWEHHWEKYPLHWKASEHGKTGNQLPKAISVDDVMHIVRSSGSSLKMFRRGEAYDMDDFLVGYLDGASLIVNQADRCFPPLLEFCQELARRHFFHVFGVIYLTPPESQAVRLHTDDQDVFLLQIWGNKRWTIRNAPQLLPYTEEMLGKDTAVPEELVKEPVLEFTMEPHDILYIPRGYLHEARTGGEEPSLHVTVTVPTSDYCWGVQLVKHLAHKVQQKDFAEDLKDVCSASLSVRGTHGSLDTAALDAKIEELVKAWADTVTADDVLDQFDSRMQRTNDGQERAVSQKQARPPRPCVTENSRVRLMYGISCRCEADSEQAIFSRATDGQHLELSIRRSASALIRSLNSRPQRVLDLPCEDAFERLCVLEILQNHGVVQLLLQAPPGDDD